MKNAFEQTMINNTPLKNRFVRSATWEGLAGKDGACTDAIRKIMVELAKGQIGLLITSHAYVHPSGQAGFGQLGIHSNYLIPGYRKLVEQVHQLGSKIIVQLNHGGCRSDYSLTGRPRMGPSELSVTPLDVCEKMTLEQIDNCLTYFKKAAHRAFHAGFDGIQIHAAHGFLVSEFLSPYFNHRADNYGGNLKNRSRFLLNIVHSIRSHLGGQLLLSVKINSEDFLSNGFSIHDMIQTCQWLEQTGVDVIELSGGISSKISQYSPSRTGCSPEKLAEVYYEKAAGLLKRKVSIPVILVGGIRSFDTVNRLLRENKADYISLCRPLIREPFLIKRWQEGDRRDAECISCNRCFGPIRKGEGISCVLLDKKSESE